MGSHEHSSEMQLAPLVVCEEHTMWRVSARESSPCDAVLLFCSSKQTGADEQVEDVVAFCHGTFVAVDFRHELAQRRSKGSLSSTADPILALLKVTLLLGCWYSSVT